MIDSLSRQNVIGRMRVAGTNVDALSARLRATMLLNAVNLEAAQPSPSAIVFIRKLRDPMPGVLSLTGSAIEPPMEWKNALDGALRSVVARAGRPAIEAVNGNEEAIVFADRGELLACLAADLCHGTAATRWWWSSLLRAGKDLPAVEKIWQESPEYIPAALHHLSNRKVATAFVRQIDGVVAHQFVQAIAQVFGLQWLMPAVATRVAEIEPAQVETIPVAAIARSKEELSSAAPWVAEVPERAMHQLSFEQQRFVGVGLMIQRSPAVVRTKAFAQAVEEWQEEVVARAAANQQLIATPRTRPQGMPSPQSVRQTVSSPLPELHQSPDTAFQKEEVDEPPIQTPKPAAVDDVLASLTTTELPESIPSEVIGQPLTEPPRVIVQSEPIEETEAPVAHSSTTPASTVPSTFETRELVDETIISIKTDLGGLFYLINLGLYLNLYADFTSPLEPGIELNIWDFVALVGDELLEGDHADDPIWSALAKLAGRDETEPPGVNFDPEGEWLSSFMPHARARLRSALGLEVDDEIPAILCRHSALLRATDTHVDVYFRLADLPLAIRFAGLDRDPGWVPAAGRFISFHFD